MGNGQIPHVPDDATAQAPQEATPATVAGRNTADASASFDLFDLAAVISTAVFLLLIVIFLAGALAGNQVLASLPSWLTDTAKATKAAVAALGTSAILQIIRARLGRKTNPQYIGTTIGVFFLLLVSTVFLSKLLPQPQPIAGQPYTPAQVRFTTRYPADTEIKFVHHYHAQLNENLIPQSKPDAKVAEYLAHVDLPADASTQFSATFGELVPHSYLSGYKTGGFLEMCLHRAKGAPPSGSEIFLKCEDQDCSIDPGRDLGLAISCSADDQGRLAPDNPFNLLFPQPVLAAGMGKHAIQSSVPYWTVPTLDTLEHAPAKDRIGYTRFEIQLKPSAALSSSDGYQYQVFVNGQPIYFNGFPPETFRDRFDPSKPLNLSFGLENLNFSGADGGFENLTVVLTFFKGQTQTIKQPVSRKYVALRNPPTITLPSASGTFQWSGEYVIPSTENKYELFVNSFPKVEQAMELKSSFDKRHLDAGKVLVVRPPLRLPPFFGVVIGDIQPTGQVQFTFSRDEINGVCSWAKSHKDWMIHSDLHIYQVSNGLILPCG